MTPEATWLAIAVAASALYTAGWVGWKLREQVYRREWTVSARVLRRLQQMREDEG